MSCEQNTHFTWKPLQDMKITNNTLDQKKYVSENKNKVNKEIHKLNKLFGIELWLWKRKKKKKNVVLLTFWALLRT